MQNLLREHCSHPLLIWRDAAAELNDTPFWGSYPLSRIVSESSMLDTRKLTVGVRARMEAGEQLASFNVGEVQTVSEESADEHLENETETASISKSQRTVLQPISLSPEKIVIRLDDMIKTSMALRSGMDIAVEPPNGEWAGELVEVFASVARFRGSSTKGSEGAVHEHITETLTSLQRELLLLRNELNFELWLSRENAKHIGQLYQDRILIRTAEAERQGLVSFFFYFQNKKAKFPSTTNYASTVHRFLPSRLSSLSTDYGRPRIRGNMQTGTQSCSKS